MEYIKIIEELNNEMYEKHGDQYEQWFYTCSGYIDMIGFGDIILWDSENGCRKEDIESYKIYLKRKLKKYGKKLISLSK